MIWIFYNKMKCFIPIILIFLNTKINHIMKKVLIAVSIIAFVFATGCKTKDSGNPTPVLAAFFDAMVKQDSAAVLKLCTPESRPMLELIKGKMNSTLSKEAGKYDKSKVDFGTAVINGENAKVPVTDKSSGEVTNFPMKKIGGEWKVAFDMGSLMEMGMEKFQQHGGDIRQITEKLNKMNADSIMNAHGLNADSMK